MPWLRKPISVFFVLIGSYVLFDFLKEVSWTFFLFLNQDTFPKYILNYQGPFKLLQQLKNDQMMYFSFTEAVPFVLPLVIFVSIAIWLNNKLQKATLPLAVKLRHFSLKESKFLIWLNFVITLCFLYSFTNYSRIQYIRSVNEFIQFKIWMIENDRKVDTGCVYYPKRNETFYFDIDSIDFVSHFLGYSLSPLSDSLKDVLAITSETPVNFEESLCDSEKIDPQKSYSSKDVIRLMNEYSESCGKKNVIKELKLKNYNAPIRIEKRGYVTLMSINYKPFASVDFKCSKDSREIMEFRFHKTLNGD